MFFLIPNPPLSPPFEDWSVAETAFSKLHGCILLYQLLTEFMSTQKQPSGRRASKAQRDFALEVLHLFEESKDVNVLTAAIKHFSQTGDFSPFGLRDQYLQKRAKFLRLLLQVKELRGKEKSEFIARIASDLSISEESAKRMLEGKTQVNSTLVGADRLFEFLERQPKKNSIKQK